MKKLLFFSLIMLSLAFVGFSQTIPPPYINYQAVLYDVNSANPNTPLTNQSFTTFVNINDELGNLLYREEHYASTDANGLITVKIGDGAYDAGSISNLNDINWGVGKYFLVVDFVINGDTSSTASEQLVTVPYSFYAGNAGNGMTAVADNGNGTLTFTYANGQTYITPALSGIQGAVGPAGPPGTSGSAGPQGAPGPQGQAGVNGTNGLNALIKTTTEPVGVNCANGGTKIEAGLDANGNGVLDAGEVNAGLTNYVCNGVVSSNAITPIQSVNSSGNYSTISGIPLPSFLNYFGDCSAGNKVCVNNEVLVNNSKFCNLTIPNGFTAKINPEVTTIIYVSDTLFLHGTINGVGLNEGAVAMNSTSNHLGATAGGFSSWDKCSSVFTGGSSLSFSWIAGTQPDAYYEGIGGNITIPVGNFNNTIYSCSTGPACSATNGTDISVNNLLVSARFGLDISGGNASKLSQTQCSQIPYKLGGQGGGGLFILAKNIVYQGDIILNGGNGGFCNDICNNSASNRWWVSGGGGGGSFVLRTNNMINGTGTFTSNGGNRIGPNACGIKGGNGSMIVLTGQ